MIYSSARVTSEEFVTQNDWSSVVAASPAIVPSGSLGVLKNVNLFCAYSEALDAAVTASSLATPASVAYCSEFSSDVAALCLDKRAEPAASWACWAAALVS